MPIGEFHQHISPQIELYIQQTIDQPSAIKNLEQIFKLVINSPYLTDPFYKMFHALQFTEAYALQQAAKARDTEIEYLERFLEKVHLFHPVPNIPLAARLLFTTGENLNLYINHLGEIADPADLLQEAILMFERYIFGNVM